MLPVAVWWDRRCHTENDCIRIADEKPVIPTKDINCILLAATARPLANHRRATGLRRRSFYPGGHAEDRAGIKIQHRGRRNVSRWNGDQVQTRAIPVKIKRAV